VSVSKPASGPTPLLLVKGNATEQEVAALVAVLQGVASASAAAASASDGRPSRSVWASPARGVRTPDHSGPGGWRASTLPR
jgi:hypothetical protein